MARVFFLLNGNNGATYIVNTRNLRSVITSLRFYKARTWKSVLIKSVLIILSWVLGKINFKKLKNNRDVNLFLNKLASSQFNFNIDENSSVLISPTKDKVIVNHHDDYFQKFAFDKSYSNVKNEADIYKLFSSKNKQFQTSKIYDVLDHNKEIISFKLSNKEISSLEEKQKLEDLVLPCLEFFRLTQREISMSCYVRKLKLESQTLNLEQLNYIATLLQNIEKKHSEKKFQLGLVHRDFKPWNIKFYKKPLFFDFEETIKEGAPLEDMFNYLIDPVLQVNTPKELFGLINRKRHVKVFNRYLNLLDIKINYLVFFELYCVNRIVFWNYHNKVDASQKYLELLMFVEHNK